MLRLSKSPFPGMDPFLEAPELWRGLHGGLAHKLVEQLNRQIAPAYHALAEINSVYQAVDLSRPKNIFPDVAVYESDDQDAPFPSPSGAVTLEAPVRREVLQTEEVKLRRVKIHVVETGELVTVIEILSPANKRGQGLADYQAKRERLLLSQIHLVEIDLLRGGKRPGPELNRKPALDTDYILLTNRIGETRTSEIWPVPLNEPLPKIPVPLLYPDPDAILDLTTVIHELYQSYRYDVIIDYAKPIPSPSLRSEMEKWWQDRKREVHPTSS